MLTHSKDRFISRLSSGDLFVFFGKNFLFLCLFLCYPYFGTFIFTWSIYNIYIYTHTHIYIYIYIYRVRDFLLTDTWRRESHRLIVKVLKHGIFTVQSVEFPRKTYASLLLTMFTVISASVWNSQMSASLCQCVGGVYRVDSDTEIWRWRLFGFSVLESNYAMYINLLLLFIAYFGSHRAIVYALCAPSFMCSNPADVNVSL